MTIDQLRRKIDAIDRKIVRLLVARARLALQIGERKRKASAPVQDKQREREVIRRVKRLNTGPAGDRAMEEVYRRIIRMCLDVQGKGRKRRA